MGFYEWKLFLSLEIINLLENPKEHENKFYLNSDKKLNEMLLLNIVYIKFPELFNMLNIIPIEQSKFVFDPADYGQYLGGLDGKPFSKKTIDIDHYVGRELIKNNLKPIMKNNWKDSFIRLKHTKKKNLKIA